MVLVLFSPGADAQALCCEAKRKRCRRRLFRPGQWPSLSARRAAVALRRGASAARDASARHIAERDRPRRAFAVALPRCASGQNQAPDFARRRDDPAGRKGAGRPKRRSRAMTGAAEASRLTQISTLGGSTEKEVAEVAVSPVRSSPLPTVITATAPGSRRKALRNVCPSTAASGALRSGVAPSTRAREVTRES